MADNRRNVAKTAGCGSGIVRKRGTQHRDFPFPRLLDRGWAFNGATVRPGEAVAGSVAGWTEARTRGPSFSQQNRRNVDYGVSAESLGPRVVALPPAKIAIAGST